MPYIKQEARIRIEGAEVEGLRESNDVVCVQEPETVGELNYAITILISSYFKRNGRGYLAIAEITGALVNAKDEFYRRVAVPYEEAKIKENGDVY